MIGLRGTLSIQRVVSTGQIKEIVKKKKGKKKSHVMMNKSNSQNQNHIALVFLN